MSDVSSPQDSVFSAKDMDAVLQLTPQDASALYVRGLSKQRLGDVAGGEADIARAKAIQPNIADTK